MNITLERAWELCPEAMVEFDRRYGHIPYVMFCHYDSLVDTHGIGLTFSPDWPGHPTCPGKSFTLCVDWIVRERRWRVAPSHDMDWIGVPEEYLRRRSEAYSVHAESR